MKAMGLKVTAKDVRKVPSSKETAELVAMGLNLNGHLCASVISIAPLKNAGVYEITCVANRGGSAKKTYMGDSKTGRADEL